MVNEKSELEVQALRGLGDEAPTVADVLRAVSFAMPALEIARSRITNCDIGIVDTVADNASSGFFVNPARALEARLQCAERAAVGKRSSGRYALIG